MEKYNVVRRWNGGYDFVMDIRLLDYKKYIKDGGDHHVVRGCNYQIDEKKSGYCITKVLGKKINDCHSSEAHITAEIHVTPDDTEKLIIILDDFDALLSDSSD